VPSKADRRRRFKSDLGVYGLPGDVSPWDIRFDPKDRAFLDREADGRYRIRVWAEPGLKEGLVVARRNDEHLGFPLRVIATTDRFEFWEAVVELLPNDLVSLAFRNPSGKAVYLVPDGISNAVERLDRWTVPDLEPMDIPSWSQGAVIYQIFPDRFANGDSTNDPPDTDPWGSPPHSRRFQGGDLAGITQRLDYLNDLGADLIYLTPIFTSPSNHRYDAVDYTQVDPSLGGNEALIELVKASHDRGIRVILDASFNHCHPGFFAFQDLVHRGLESPYRGWFVVHDWPVRIKARKSLKGWQREWLPVWAEQSGLAIEHVLDRGLAVEPTYESWYGVATMPRINLANPDARGYMLEVAVEWPRLAGIDGWRMDVARYVDSDFWVDFRKAVKDSNPESYLIGEFMGDAGAWLQGDRFDATMNYTFRDICLRFLARNEIGAEEAADDLARLWAQYAWPVTLANQNLIGSHDTPRFLSLAGGKEWRLRLAIVLSLTFPGAPGVYYGDEIGLKGGNDPGSRNAFPWEPDPTAHDLHRTVKELARLRRKHPSLVKGEWRPLLAERGLLAFERFLGRERLAVVVNRGKRRRIDLPRKGKVLWGDAELDKRKLTIAPRAAAVVRLGR
jgi:cyclomaltodextrinase / maltogenic alpha-amylase / neopullulanase